MKSLLPPTGPWSKSISGQCTAIFGRPGSAPSAISSMLGCVAAVRATESPSQLNPPLIHKTWMRGASVAVADDIGLALRDPRRAGPVRRDGGHRLYVRGSRGVSGRRY